MKWWKNLKKTNLYASTFHLILVWIAWLWWLKKHLKKQAVAEKMTKRLDETHLSVKVGNKRRWTYILSIIRAKSDLWNISEVVTEITENEFHKIGTQFGLLDQIYANRYVQKNKNDVNYMNYKLGINHILILWVWIWGVQVQLHSIM